MTKMIALVLVLGLVACNSAPLGPRGFQGDPGAPGVRGEQGAQAAAGAAGAVGMLGPMGPAGAMGPQGPMGLQGDVGPAGVAGATGAQGMPGAIGAAGAQGAKGVAGIAGAPGIAGKDFTPSKANTYEVTGGPTYLPASTVNNGIGFTSAQCLGPHDRFVSGLCEVDPQTKIISGRAFGVNDLTINAHLSRKN